MRCCAIRTAAPLGRPGGAAGGRVVLATALLRPQWTTFTGVELLPELHQRAAAAHTRAMQEACEGVEGEEVGAAGAERGQEGSEEVLSRISSAVLFQVH